VNDFQAVRRIESVLRARLWRGFVGDAGVGNKIWQDGSVMGTQEVADDGIDSMPPPLVAVSLGEGRADPEHPEIVTQEFIVTLGVAIAGDQVGRSALLGANRADKDSSAGRGLLEFQAELYDALALLGDQEQFNVHLAGIGHPRPIINADVGYMLLRAYRFEGIVTVAPTYQRPATFSGSVLAGTVTLVWTAPDDTAGLVDYVVRRVSGTIPTPFPDGGTGIALGSPLDLTVDNIPGSGTWTYSLFGGYDDLGGATPINHSDYRFATVTVP
jgi:hypothetical protein